MRSPRASLAALLALIAFPATAAATGGDTWPTHAHDGHRSARASGKGAMGSAPEVAWKLPMGGALSDVQVTAFDVDGDGDREAIVVSAGRVVAKKSDDTAAWSGANIGATRVFGVADLDGQGPAEVLAEGTSPLGLYILSAQTGATLWFQPTTTPGIDVLTTPNPSGGRRLFLTQQLGQMIGYQFASGVISPAANLVFSSATSPWSIDLAAADVDGDGQLEVVRGHDRGFIAYDAATGAVRCDASSLIGNTVAPSYFPAFTGADVDGDGRAEIVLYDYSYYYSEDAGVFVVACGGNGALLAPQTLWSQQWITDVTPGPGNDVNDKQIRYLADGVANLDGQGPLEIVYSLWDGAALVWTTYVRNAATGAVLATRPGEVIEGVLDVDADVQPEVLLREATGIGVLPKPFFSKLRGYDFAGGALTDKGWIVPEARAATIGGFRGGLVTPGAGAVAAHQNVNGAADPAAEAYVFQKAMGTNPTDLRPGKLLAVHGTDGLILRKYEFPDHVSGSVLMLADALTAPAATSQSLVMLTDGGLRAIDDKFVEKAKILPGNHSRFVTVASLDGVKNLIFGVTSSDALVAIDGTGLENGAPVIPWRLEDAAQTETRGYVSAPGLVIPAAAGAARLVVRGHATASYEEQALVALEADGTTAWKTNVGPGRQIPGFDSFELLDDLDGDGTRDFFLTELAPDSSQELVVRRGSDGGTMVARPTGDVFPPEGVYLQGHASADIDGDGVLDVVSSLHGSWFVGIDLSLAGTGDPALGLAQIFRTSNGPNGQAMVGHLDADPELDLVRVASQNAFGPYEKRSLDGAIEASYQPPTLGIAASDANTAALLVRDADDRDLVWSGMAGDALGAVARLDGFALGEVWFDYLAAGVVYPKAQVPANRAALFSPIAADVDGDGDDEVLVGSDDGFLYALAGSDGSLLWSVDLGAPVVHVIAADVDKDDALELLAVLADGTLVALDAPGGYDFDVVITPEGGTGGAGGVGGATGAGGAGASGGGGGAVTGAGTGGGGVSSAGGAGGNDAKGGGSGDEGGCGCRVAGSEGAEQAGALGWIALATSLLARRRRRVKHAP